VKNKLIFAHLAVLTVNLIYAGNYFIAKGVMPEYLNPDFFIMIRIAGAVSLFWIINFFIGEKIQRKHIPRIMLCGLFGIALNQLLFFKGLSITSGVDAAIIMTCTPVLVTIFSFAILKTSFHWLNIVGIIIGLAGAAYIVMQGASDSSEASWAGNLLVLGNASSYAIYLVIVKPLMKTYKPVTVITWMFTFGLLYILPFGLYGYSSCDFSFGINGVWAIIYVVLGATFITYLFNLYGISKLNPSIVSSYIYLQPVFTMLIATCIALYHDKPNFLTLEKGIATLLIFAGVYLVGKKVKVKGE